MVVAAALPGDLGAVVQPHGFGRWQERGAMLDFFVECDSGDEPISRITAALAGYDELARANLKLATVTLLWMTTPEREAEARRTLHPSGCLVATATPAGGGNPAEAVWLPSALTSHANGWPTSPIPTAGGWIGHEHCPISSASEVLEHR